jgi:hypothetical protein
VGRDITTALAGLASFAELEQLLKARLTDGSREADMTFEAFEQELGQTMRGLESDLKAADLSRYDVDAGVIVVDGREWRKCLEHEPKTYLTSSGPVTVERNLFRPSGGGKCICPLELRAGIVGGLYSPALARQVAYLMGHLTSAETSAVFTELGISGPSSSSCDRLPKIVSGVWEHHREQWESSLREREVVPGEAAVVAVSLDGVMVPDKDAQKEAKEKREELKKEGGLVKQPGGPAGYREVGCGTVSLYDSEAERLDTVRYGRAPEHKKKTLTEQLDAELESILDVRPDLVLVALADGAEENWRYFEGSVYENAIKIVDHGHACEHLRAAMAAYHGETSVEGRAAYERLRVILKYQLWGVNVVIFELSGLLRKLRGKGNKRRRKLLKKELTYFENQAERMNYADYQERGLPIGSGIVEAACKTLAAQRLKRSGMSWRDGKQAILTIRSLQQSNRWSQAWGLVAAHFRVGVLEVRHHDHLHEITRLDKAA